MCCVPRFTRRLQSREGYWDASNGLGLALLARRAAPTPREVARTHDRGSALKGPGEIFKTLIDIYQNVSGVGDGLGAGEDENLNDTGDPDQEEKEEKEDGDSDGGEGGGGEGEGGGRCPSASACPLSGHDATAVAWSLPGVLAELAEAGACPVPALRLWGTLLAIEALRSLDVSFLVQKRSAEAQTFDETIMDRACAWVAAQARRMGRPCCGPCTAATCRGGRGKPKRHRDWGAAVETAPRRGQRARMAEAHVSMRRLHSVCRVPATGE